MSWLFSQALVEASLGGNFLGGKHDAPLNGTPTPRAFLWQGKTTDFSRPSRFGMTFSLLTDDLGRALLTWCLGDSHARTLALQEKALASTVSDQACGVTWRGWLAKYDPDSYSWRTPQRSFIEDLDESSAILPRSGMTRGGLLWELPMLERLTSGTASGLWPTPTANQFECRDMGAMLARREKAKQKSGNGNGFGLTLANAVKLHWPTPSTIGINGGSNSRAAAKRRGATSAELNGGSLNPTWVEWLMGWPLGWTDLGPSATDKFRSAQLLHSKRSQQHSIEVAA